MLLLLVVESDIGNSDNVTAIIFGNNKSISNNKKEPFFYVISHKNDWDENPDSVIILGSNNTDVKNNESKIIFVGDGNNQIGENSGPVNVFGSDKSRITKNEGVVSIIGSTNEIIYNNGKNSPVTIVGNNNSDVTGNKNKAKVSVYGNGNSTIARNEEDSIITVLGDNNKDINENSGSVSIAGNNNTGVQSNKNLVIVGHNNEDIRNVSDTFILASNVTNVQSNSVVLGNASAGKAVTEVLSQEVAGTTYNFAGVASQDNGSVSVGAEGKERQIHYVAAGEVSATSADAVNGSQLHAAYQSIKLNDARISNMETKVDRINGRIDVLNKQIHAAGTTSMAMGNLVQAYRPGQNSTTVALGHYGDASAIAFGLSTIADDSKWGAKISFAANTESEFGAGAGLGYFW